MKKVAVVFVLAVFVPSLVLAWLAVRSLRDQQFLLERQQSLLYQGVADAAAKQVQDALAEYQHAFAGKAGSLLAGSDPRDVARSFDESLHKDWPLAQVGFVVTSDGDILSPSRTGRLEARTFYAENDRFLANRETVEAYRNWNYNGKVVNLGNQSFANTSGFANGQALEQIPRTNAPNVGTLQGQNTVVLNEYGVKSRSVNPQYQSRDQQNRAINNLRNVDNTLQAIVRTNASAQLSQSFNQTINSFDNGGSVQAQNPKLPVAQASQAAQFDAGQQARVNVIYPGANANPGQIFLDAQQALQANSQDENLSSVAASEAEFRQLIGDDTEGTLARFVENKLNVLVWCRSSRDPSLIFGALLSLPRLIDSLAPLLEQVDSELHEQICVALLDDLAKPVALSHPGFRAAWKRPLVATEIGESLPHWEVAVYPLDPGRLTRSAQAVRLTLGLLIGVLVLAIGIGSWLIVADLNRHITLARQKTDFVSNVSHELKTPLTSIRMFSELLAEGRVTDPARQRSYLGIITSETARLTRLINNVLDFARLERGEKKFRFENCDVAGVVHETAESYRPHLETNGFKFECDLPESPIYVNGDRDGLAQVVVNLLSNAEKYSDGCKELTVRVSEQQAPLPHVEVRVLDRGLGVPAGCGEKIFEKFYRAHDSLSSGIQGSGLGLTLARQIARAHGGEVSYEARDGGGSCFVLRLPLKPRSSDNNP
jgi:signal transduction histidine kinase